MSKMRYRKTGLAGILIAGLLITGCFGASVPDIQKAEEPPEKSQQTLDGTSNIKISYLPTQNDSDIDSKETIQASQIADTLRELSLQHFPFKQPLTIEFGSEEGPLYDPERHTISVPYEFYQQNKVYFASNGYEKRYGKSTEMGAIDSLLHTLLHEAGHAYISENDIPVLGKEEDAVDDFATMMLINYVDNGDDVAISGADMFAFEADDVSLPEYYMPDEYVDEHSFDLQRYFSTLCLVYGSNPERHATLLDEMSKDNLSERQESCEYRFTEVNHNWEQYLP